PPYAVFCFFHHRPPLLHLRAEGRREPGRDGTRLPAAGDPGGRRGVGALAGHGVPHGAADPAGAHRDHAGREGGPARPRAPPGGGGRGHGAAQPLLHV
ncbi:unnamed protein product, partial [Prorocentrum cordatum]